MAANTLPIFPVAPNWKSSIPAFVATSLTLGNPSTLALAFTAGAAGSRVDSITVMATATTTAGQIRIWVYFASGTPYLLMTILVTAVVPSATVAPWQSEQLPVNWTLPIGATLYASTEKNESFALHVRGGDY